MSESPKRLTTEEVWATALAVIGGLAVLVPLIVFALRGQDVVPPGTERPDTPPVVSTEPGGKGQPEPVSTQPLPNSISALRKELVEARGKIDALNQALELAKSDVEASERSAKRAWIQLREAAGESDGSSEGSNPSAVGNETAS